LPAIQPTADGNQQCNGEHTALYQFTSESEMPDFLFFDSLTSI